MNALFTLGFFGSSIWAKILRVKCAMLFFIAHNVAPWKVYDSEILTPTLTYLLYDVSLLVKQNNFNWREKDLNFSHSRHYLSSINYGSYKTKFWSTLASGSVVDKIISNRILSPFFLFCLSVAIRLIYSVCFGISWNMSTLKWYYDENF